MKKLVSFVLVLALALSMSVGAFAAEVTPTEPEKITLKKTYEINNGTAPKETFTFNIENAGKSDSGMETQPAATIEAVTFEESNETKTDNITIGIPSYETVGIYTYKITETAGNTAGVTYYGSPIYLKVTVTQGETGLETAYAFHEGAVAGEKINETGITNTYNAGALSVKKEVTGNLGDRSKAFDFTVTFTAPEGKKVNSTITYNNGKETVSILPNAWNSENNTTSVEFSLKDDDTITFNNIPYGVQYTVVEDSYDDYTSTQAITNTEECGKEAVIDSALENVVVTNEKDGGAPDTGITLDSMPYILVLACVAAAGVGMIARKRRIDD